MINYKKEALRALDIMKNVNKLLDQVTAEHMLAQEAETSYIN